jgi:tetratricopeptide (TPR) repeat protein
VTLEEARRVLALSRGLQWAFPSSFGNPGLDGEAPAREQVVEAAHTLSNEEATELAANAWRLWMVAPRDVDGGRRFLAAVRADSRGLYGAGLLALRGGDVDESRRLNEQALELAGDDPEALALAHLGLSRVALEEGDAGQLLFHALAAREAAEPLRLAMGQALLHMHAQAVRLAGDLDQAAELFEESLALNRRIGDQGMVEVELYNLGLVNVRRGDAAAAERYLSGAADDPLAGAALAYVKGDLEAAKTLLARVGGDLPSDDRAELEWLRSRF